jgi:hypothetical protein
MTQNLNRNDKNKNVMKLKHLLYIFILGAGLTACASDDNVTDSSADKAQVNIKLTRSEIDATLDSRATSAMPINSANLMYNLILLHYNSNQVLVEVATDSNSDLANGKFEETWAPTLTAGDDDYIVLLANVKQSNDVLGTLQGWNDLGADRFANFRDALVKNLPLTANSDGAYNSSQKMYMMGYYKGAVTSGMNLNIEMGRMASCIKLVIAPASGSATISKVQIDNAVMNTHYFPATSTDSLKYGSYADTPNVTATTSAPVSLYYYTGENINPTASQYTTATITVTTGATTTYTYFYSNNDTELGKTLADASSMTTTASASGDPYYSPKYYTNSTSGNSGYYTYYYSRYIYDNETTDYVGSNTALNTSDWVWDNNYDSWVWYTQITDTSLSNYYRYYKGGTYYKHRFSTSTTTSGTSKTYKVVLGSDSPTTANRNYSLYRNNTYTFNINLQ